MRIAIIANLESDASAFFPVIKRTRMVPQWLPPASHPQELAEFTGFVVLNGQDSLMAPLREESGKGKPILGIEEGAKWLAESGHVPGLENNAVGMQVIDSSTVNSNELVKVRLASGYQLNAFTRHLGAKKMLSMTLCSKKYFIIPPALLIEMQNNGQCVFHFVDNAQVAAVSNKAGNVMAMLIHPEQTADGDAIFDSMRDYIAAGHYPPISPMYYQPRY